VFVKLTVNLPIEEQEEEEGREDQEDDLIIVLPTFSSLWLVDKRGTNRSREKEEEGLVHCIWGPGGYWCNHCVKSVCALSVSFAISRRGVPDHTMIGLSVGTLAVVWLGAG
jgi:hypothetical protein